jgi:hypothetical protein
VNTLSLTLNQYLATHQPQLKRDCLDKLGSQVNFSSPRLTIEYLLDTLSEASSGRLSESESISRFLELGVQLSREGWPVRLAMETIHTYRQIIWEHLEVTFNQPDQERPDWLDRLWLNPAEFWQLSRRIDNWTERLVDAYVSHKENYVSQLSHQFAVEQPRQEIQSQTARDLSGKVYQLLSQPLTVLHYLSRQTRHGALMPDELKLFDQAVAQTEEVLKKLRNLKRYPPTPPSAAGTSQIFDFDISTS